jgi:hypothetical protein
MKMAKYRLKLDLEVNTDENLPEVRFQGSLEVLSKFFELIPDGIGCEPEEVTGVLLIERVQETSVDPY